ncbi:MAG TPA: MFS transporter [Candidatus Dormibacteraeota bacterium]|nr:MFS transporter [Candidatus Dormibacteraeota bacterium]
MSRSATGRPRSRVATSVTFFLNGFLGATWVASIPVVKDRLGLDAATLGLDLAATAVGALVLMPIAGWLVAHRGSAPVTTATALLLCAVLPLPFIAPNAVLLALALFALGASTGSMDVSMNAQAVRVEALRTTPIMSSFHGAWSVGALAAAVITSLVHLAGVPPLVQVTTVAAIAAFVQVVVAVEFERGDRAAEPPVLLALPPRPVLALGFVCFCAMLAEGAVGDWSGVYLREGLGAAAAVAPLGFAAASLAMSAARLGGDAVVQRFGPARTLAAGGSLVVVGLGAGLVVAQPLAAIVGFALVGLGVANAVPVMFSAAGRIPGVPAGTALAAASTMGYSGFLVGPTVIGLVAQATSLPTALWIPVGCALVLAVAGPRALAAVGASAAAPSAATPSTG